MGGDFEHDVTCPGRDHVGWPCPGRPTHPSDLLAARLVAAGIDAECWHTGGGIWNPALVLERERVATRTRRGVPIPAPEGLEARRWLVLPDQSTSGDYFGFDFGDAAFERLSFSAIADGWEPEADELLAWLVSGWPEIRSLRGELLDELPEREVVHTYESRVLTPEAQARIAAGETVWRLDPDLDYVDAPPHEQHVFVRYFVVNGRTFEASRT